MIYKELSQQDVSFREYYAYKDWVLTEGNSDLSVYSLSEITTGFFNPANETTGSGGLFVRTLYDSIKHLYYHYDYRLDFIPINYYSQQMTGSTFSQAFYAPDHNFGPNTYKTHKTLESQCVAISIPQQFIGEQIKPTTLHVEDVTEGFTLYDDGYGNLYDSTESASFSANPGGYKRGNVFYEHGNIVITSLSSSYQNFGTSTNNIVIKYKSTQKIYEFEAYCTAKEGEFNYSMNPSLRVSGSLASPDLKGMVTSSEFSTYPTTIGLYNNNNELMIVGKFNQPIRNDNDLGITFVVRLDL